MPTALHLLLLGVLLLVVMATANWTPPQDWSPSVQLVDSEDCRRILESGVPPDQMPWFCVCSHCSMPGPKGDRGDRGLPGGPGGSGRRGLTGFRGAPGFVGRPGIKGQKGDFGGKGLRGLQGPVGPKGAGGFKGEKGEPGFEGLPGDPGPKGNDGACPENCESLEGPPGPPGVPGPVGGRGLHGDQGLPGPRGLKGDLGGAGDPGAPGASGQKGEPGPQGDCNCTDGAGGTPGPKGSKGDRGTPGHPGTRGQTGSKGYKGDQGMMGMMGPPGPCGPGIRSAFSAALTSSYPPPDAPVVFGRVLHNVLGYDPETGLYRAPVNGTYVFSYQLTVYSRVLVVGLFQNHRALAISTEPAVLGTASHSLVLHLARGDRVWVQVKDSNTNGMFAGPETSSTFSGFLLLPDSCDPPSLRGPPPPIQDSEDRYSWPETSTQQPPVPPTAAP